MLKQYGIVDSVPICGQSSNAVRQPPASLLPCVCPRRSADLCRIVAQRLRLFSMPWFLRPTKNQTSHFSETFPLSSTATLSEDRAPFATIVRAILCEYLTKLPWVLFNRSEALTGAADLLRRLVDGCGLCCLSCLGLPMPPAGRKPATATLLHLTCDVRRRKIWRLTDCGTPNRRALPARPLELDQDRSPSRHVCFAPNGDSEARSLNVGDVPMGNRRRFSTSGSFRFIVRALLRGMP